MTDEQIMEMAKQCGLVGMRPHLDGIYFEALAAFAKLVAQHVRDNIIAKNIPEIEKCNAYIKSLEDELAAIRARGES